MTDPLILAYLAGIIDSDGCITINRSTRAGKTYLAASVWGGSISRYEPKNPEHRPQFQWSRTGSAAAEAIAELLPYLRVKREQAALALELHESAMHGSGPDPFPWYGPGLRPDGRPRGARRADARTQPVTEARREEGRRSRARRPHPRRSAGGDQMTFHRASGLSATVALGATGRSW